MKTKEEKAASKKAAQKKYRDANKEKCHKASMDWAIANPDKARSIHKKHYDSHAEEIKEKARSEYQDDPEKAREQSLRYYYENKERCQEMAKQRADANPDREAKRRKKYYEDNKEKRNDASKAWKSLHKEEIKQYKKGKYHNDLNHKLAHLLRSRLYHALKGKAKKGSAVTMLGCSIEELCSHLERHFEEGMTWDNHGIYWEIDHILPLSSFDLTDIEQLKKACNFMNLQPLTIAENRTKSDKLPKDIKSI